MSWSFRGIVTADAAWISELRAVVMHTDLERLGRYDPARVRERFRDGFDPDHTRIIVVDGVDAGCIALRHEDDAVWVEHFYMASDHQGRGIGGAVLDEVLGELGDETTVRLDVLQGSPARRLYERRGFRLENEDAIDAYLVRHPAGLRQPEGHRVA